MSELKTKKSKKNAEAFVESIENVSKREDSKVLLNLMKDVTGSEPKIWGENIIGFGTYKYKRKGSKEEHEWFKLGFAARKTKLTLYLSCDISQYADLLDQLGKCKWGKGCLYINKLADINLDVLEKIIERGKDAQWHAEST